MNEVAVIHIIGTPVARESGIKDTWRALTQWVAGQLASRFGSAVTVRYFDLVDPDCPPVPADAQLPLVLINGEVLSSGGKLPLPLIYHHLESAGIQTMPGKMK
jgi:hypothetical protein